MTPSNARGINRLYLPAVSLIGLLLTGCASSPSAVFEKIEAAAKAGKAEEFASYFSEDSRPFAAALLSLYVSNASATGPVSKPLDLLTRSTVEEERIEGQRAFVMVKTPTGTKRNIVFIQDEKNAWKLDVAQTEKLNAEK